MHAPAEENRPLPARAEGRGWPKPPRKGTPQGRTFPFKAAFEEDLLTVDLALPTPSPLPTTVKHELTL